MAKTLAGVLAIAEAHAEVFCSVGTHPHNAAEELDVTADELVRLSRHPKVVAIGEAGLDYFYDKSPRVAQAQGFRTHIAAARETGLPLVIHARDADAHNRDAAIAGLLRERNRKSPSAREQPNGALLGDPRCFEALPRAKQGHPGQTPHLRFPPARGAS